MTMITRNSSENVSWYEHVSKHVSTGFKLKDFLHDNETLSTFLLQNASLSEYMVQEIVEADVNLEKVGAGGGFPNAHTFCPCVM